MSDKIEFDYDEDHDPNHPRYQTRCVTVPARRGGKTTELHQHMEGAIQGGQLSIDDLKRLRAMYAKMIQTLPVKRSIEYLDELISGIEAKDE